MKGVTQSKDGMKDSGSGVGILDYMKSNNTPQIQLVGY